MAKTDCRHFNGYKPCSKNKDCSHSCPHYNKPDYRVLIIHLEALGSVLRATSILNGVKKKYKNCHITWVTQSPAHHLLHNNPLIDRVFTTSAEDLLSLSCLSFDVAMCVDKSLKSAGVLKLTSYNQVFGFVADHRGALLPATEEAEELWRIGLSDHLKFFVNRKPETQLLWEALGLGEYHRDEYIYQMTPEEVTLANSRRSLWAGADDKLIIGINTGCSQTIAYKKLSVDGHRKLIQLIGQNQNMQVVLLGGKEDAERNSLIAKTTQAIESPTGLGLRDGACSIAACDYVISGDSFGMHMAIALKKWVIAWFGPTCDHEIDLYDRGSKIKTTATCSPCWRRSCQKEIMCYDLVELEKIVELLNNSSSNNKHNCGSSTCLTSLYKQPSWETSF